MSTQEWIDQRLDALDRALLGLVPRGERLEFVASVQARLEAQPTETTDPATEVATACEPSAAASSTSRRRQRSAVALTACLLGIVALALLFALPVTYFVVAAASEALGELVTYTLLSANILVVALGGGAAIVLGIVALVRLGRQRGQLGHGWAITGLCTGPLPALAGGLGMIAFVFPLMAELADSGISTVPCTTGACYAPSPNDAPLVGVPVQVVANSPYASVPAQPWLAAPLPAGTSGAYGEAPKYSPAPVGQPTALPALQSPPDGNASDYAPPAQKPQALPADPAPVGQPVSGPPAESVPSQDAPAAPIR